MKLVIEISSVTPLILNRFHDAVAMGATSGTRTAMIAGDRGTPREQAEKKLYLGRDEKTLIVPGPNIFSCIVAAGSFHKAGRTKITTQKSSLIPACVTIEDIEIPLHSKEGWSVDTRAVRIPATGGRILAHRPIFNDWKLRFHIELDESFLSEKLLRQIVDDAGKRVGLGDFRPSCKGPYGKFVVNHWNIEKEN